MNMKKIFVSLFAAALLLSSCNKAEKLTDGENPGGNNDTNVTDPGNSGNTNGNTDDTNMENNDGENSENPVGSDAENEDTGNSGVTKVESAEDAISFIDANVYSQCADILPSMVGTRALANDDMSSITYNTGLTDTSGITDVILSESEINAVAYSLVYLRTDGSNTAEIQTALGESIDPGKWICVTAESVESITLDDDILLVMGSEEQVDTIMDAVVAAAEGVYENIGSVVDFS